MINASFSATDSTPLLLTTTYEYDALYRLTNMDSTDNGEDRLYSYDKVGSRKSIQSNGGTPFYYIYNPGGYDAPPQGNRLLEIRLGVPTGAVVSQFWYDDAGRITRKVDGANNGVKSYAVTGNLSSRLKSCPGNCPFIPVAPQSSN